MAQFAKYWLSGWRSNALSARTIPRQEIYPSGKRTRIEQGPLAAGPAQNRLQGLRPPRKHRKRMHIAQRTHMPAQANAV